MLKLLIFGDIVGRLGREALRRALPELKEKYAPDLILANVENLAHGKGASEKTLDELKVLGVDMFTSGNHIFVKKEVYPALDAPDSPVIRPANYPPGTPGKGWTVRQVGTKTVAVINLLGRVFMRDLVDDPFRVFDSIVATLSPSAYPLAPIVIVDFHGEATSEKAAFGWHADGRAALVFGTHTHVPTSDAKILPGGTGFITDVGMTGGRDTVIGVEKEIILKNFRTGLPVVHNWPDTGWAVVNGLYAEIDPASGKTIKMEQIQREIEI